MTRTFAAPARAARPGRWRRLWAAALLALAAGRGAAADPDPRADPGCALERSGPAVTALAVPAQGGLAAEGNARGDVAVWDLQQRARTWRVSRAHQGGVAGLAWDREGQTLYSLGTDGRVKAWDPARGGKALRESAPVDGGAGLWVGPDRRFLLVALKDGSLQAVRCQDLSSGRRLKSPTSAPVVALLALADGHYVSGQSDGTLTKGDPDTGAVVSVTLSAAALDLSAIRQDGEEKYLAVLLADGTAAFLAVRDLSPLKTVPLSGDPTAFAFVTDEGHRALQVGPDGGLRAFRLPGGAPDGETRVPGTLTAAVAVDDGHRVLVGSADGSLRLWRHPGVQAAFLRLLDNAEAAVEAGRFESALPAFGQALALYDEPGVRSARDKARAAQEDALHAQRDRMKALARGDSPPAAP